MIEFLGWLMLGGLFIASITFIFAGFTCMNISGRLFAIKVNNHLGWIS